MCPRKQFPVCRAQNILLLEPLMDGKEGDERNFCALGSVFAWIEHKTFFSRAVDVRKQWE